MLKKDIESNNKYQIPQWVGYFIAFMVIVLFWHFLLNEYSGDSVKNFSNMTDPLLERLVKRYQTWSSRTLLEAMLIPLSRHLVLWKISNVLIYALFAFSLLRLTDYKYPRLVLGLWIIYPVIEMSSAGWIATYMNYLWPLAVGTYAFVSLKKIYNNEKVHAFEWFTFTLAFIFAANVEQMVVMIMGILLVFGIDNYFVKKSRSGICFYILTWVICIANLFYILLSPGNKGRSWTEIKYINDYGTLSVIDKGVLGVVDTIDKLVTENFIFILFVSFIFVLGVLNEFYNCRIKENSKFYMSVIRACYIFPLATTLIVFTLKVFDKFGISYFSYISGIFSNIEKVSAVNWNNFIYYIPFIIFMLMIIAVIISLLNLFEDERKNIILASLFVIGLITRVMMGFSPTLYASNRRTFIFFDAILIFNIVLMYRYSADIRNRIPKLVMKAFSWIFNIIVVFALVRNTIALCSRWG